MSVSDLAISVRNLGKSYRIAHNATRHVTLAEAMLDRLRHPFRRQTVETFHALRAVSFDVFRGDVVGIIGRNGAGKSTLLKILSRITRPNDGRVDLYGRVGSLLEVGTGFHPELTGRENIYLNGHILGMRKKEVDRQFDAIVDFAGVEQFLDTPVKRYSSGMYVRLAFAVAAHLDSELLIVDEVLAVGDADFQKKCLGKMEALAHGGRTVLLVSHVMPTITRLCSRAILLDQGRVHFAGNTSDAIREYLRAWSGQSAERIWADGSKPPGDDIALLRAVRVRDHTGRVAESIDIQRGCTLEIDYEQLKEGPRIRPTAVLHLCNATGTVLFSSADFVSPSWRSRVPCAGAVRSRCRIPGNFLAEGRFAVLAAVCSYNPDIVHAVERDAIAFHVVDRSEGDGVRGPCAQPWPGELRPMLEWEIADAGETVCAHEWRRAAAENKCVVDESRSGVCPTPNR